MLLLINIRGRAASWAPGDLLKKQKLGCGVGGIVFGSKQPHKINISVK